MSIIITTRIITSALVTLNIDNHSMCFWIIAVLTHLAIEDSKTTYLVEYSDHYKAYLQ